MNIETVEVTEAQPTCLLRLNQMNPLLQEDRESAELRNHPFFRRELPEFLPEPDVARAERAIRRAIVATTALLGVASLAAVML